MTNAVDTALIAGGISVAVGLLSFLATWRTLASEHRRQERELQRRLTEKLIERRLIVYPKAFEITEPLRLYGVRSQLTIWDRTEAALIMSRECLQTYRSLRDGLAIEPSGGVFTREQLDSIWHAKNDFRHRMRADVNLLYGEEPESNQPVGA